MKNRALPTLALLLTVAVTHTTLAHEVRPAYLQLRQTAAETYDVLWKVPARGEDLRFGLYAEFPEGCANLSEPRAVFAGGSFTERWSVNARAA